MTSQERWEKETAERERRYWKQLAKRAVIIGPLLLIFVPIIFVALGVWINFLFEHARTLMGIQ
jgi:hypothetical protein